MKKLLILVLTTALLLTGCQMSASSSVTYKVSTGDHIKVSIDAGSGYSQDEKHPIVITQDKEEISQGAFATTADYDAYAELVSNAEEGVRLLDQGERDGMEYFFYRYSDGQHTEYNYVIQIGDSDTAVLLGNTISDESARSCFDSLTFSLDE